MKLLLLSAAMAVLAVSGNCLAEEPATVDPALNGRWFAVSAEGAGVKKTREELTETKAAFVFQDGELTVERFGQTRTGTYSTVQTEEPQQLDLVVTVNGQEHPLKAIYKIEEDTLILCHPKNKGDRPEEFAKTDTFLISTYEREAK